MESSQKGGLCSDGATGVPSSSCQDGIPTSLQTANQIRDGEDGQVVLKSETLAWKKHTKIDAP